MAEPAQLAPGELPWSEVRYRAVRQADGSQDGQYFFAVRTTGIFCYPSCSCRKPRPDNVRFFVDGQAARAAGFRPCKRCRPDLEGGVRGYELALIRQATQVVAGAAPASSAKVSSPADLARALSVSPAYLNRLFHRHLQQPVGEWLLTHRLERAAQLLRAGLPLLEVASLAGFRSQSAFYQAFGQRYGVAPGAYRAALIGDASMATAGSPAGTSSGPAAGPTGDPASPRHYNVAGHKKEAHHATADAVHPL